LEKLFEEGEGFISEEAGVDVGFGVEEGGMKLRKAALRVGGTIHEGTNLCPGQSPCTHGTRFQGYIQSAFAEVLTPQVACSGRQAKHFGMGCRVL
jgi:hypothetical protein